VLDLSEWRNDAKRKVGGGTLDGARVSVKEKATRLSRSSEI